MGARTFFPAGLLRLLPALWLLLMTGGCVHHTAALVPSAPVPADPSVLRVGITPVSPPLIYKEAGRISGLEAEFARGLARRTGRTLRFVSLAWKDQIPALLENRIDIIMSAMTITESRAYQISFSSPYLITGQVSLVRLKEYNRFSDGFASLMNPAVRVGTIAATTGDLLVTQNKAKGEIKRFRTPDQAVKALLDNQIDVFVYDLPMNFYLGARYADKGLRPVPMVMTREQLAWGMRREDKTLLTQANAYLAELKASGELRRKIIHWIPFYRQVYNQ